MGHYSRSGEMVSKLFAIGSPARPVLIVLVGGVYTVLMIAYGVFNIVALFFR